MLFAEHDGQSIGPFFRLYLRRKPGRPVTKNFDKAAYNREFMRKKRARLKAEKEQGK